MQLQLHYTNSTIHHNYYILQLQYTTLHPAVVGEVTDQVTTATFVATSRNTTPTTCQSISGLALPSVIHNYPALLSVSYTETSATALRGTTGISDPYM